MEHAASKVSIKENPALYVAIFNNAAIARIISTREPDVMRQAENLLWRAANVRDESGNLVEGSSVAYANLIQLERLSAVPH